MQIGLLELPCYVPQPYSRSVFRSHCDKNLNVVIRQKVRDSSVLKSSELCTRIPISLVAGVEAMLDRDVNLVLIHASRRSLGKLHFLIRLSTTDREQLRLVFSTSLTNVSKSRWKNNQLLNRSYVWLFVT